MSKNNKTKRLEATAYHEAGHAVMYYLQKIAFQHVTIKPNTAEGYSGCVVAKFPDTLNPEWASGAKVERYAEKRIMALFAGGIAAKHFTGNKMLVGADHDYVEISKLVFELSIDEERLKGLQIRAELLLTQPQNWRMVEALANALVKDETLSAVKARKIMKKAQNDYANNSRGAP